MAQSNPEPFLSKSEWAYRTVRAMILSGELEPGTSIDQQALAAQLGVSTTPLREGLRRLEAELSRTQDAVASLRDILEHSAKDLRIERRRIESAPAAAIRETVRAKDALSWFLGAMAELHATVKAQNLAPTGVLGGIFANSLFAHGRGEATLFIPCRGSVRSAARVSGCLIPQTEIAALVHEGSYSNVDVTYGALATYVARHALPMQGPIREYYLCGPQDTADETAWRTEIGWPIFHTG